MALCSNAQMNDEGFAAAIRDIERLDMMLAESVKNGQAVSNDSLPASGNSEGNPGVSMFNITGTQYPNGGPSDGDILVYSAAANAFVAQGQGSSSGNEFPSETEIVALTGNFVSSSSGLNMLAQYTIPSAGLWSLSSAVTFNAANVNSYGRMYTIQPVATVVDECMNTFYSLAVSAFSTSIKYFSAPTTLTPYFQFSAGGVSTTFSYYTIITKLRN